MPEMLPTPTPQNLHLAGGMCLRIWDFGGDGPVTLALHGFLDTGRSFAGVAQHWGPTQRILALDWRGHGESDRVGKGGSYHQLDHLKDLIQVLDLLADRGDAPRHILAHSMGAAIALLAAGTMPTLFPDRFTVLDNLGGFAMDAEDYWSRMAEVLQSTRKEKLPFRTFLSKEEALSRVQANNPHMTADGAKLWLNGAGVELEDGSIQLLFDNNLRGPNPYSFPESFWISLCKRVQAKTLVIAPEFGFFPKTSVMRQRFEALADGTLLELSGVGHHLHVDVPDQIPRINCLPK